MANYPNYNLFGKRPAESYRNLVQFNSTASNLVDSFGDDLPLLKITASVSGTSSWANNAVSASWAPDQTVTVVSASWASQSLSASWASNAVSASWAPGSTPGTTLITASTYEITASSALTASYVFGNNVHGPVLDSVSSSYAVSASWAPGDGSGTLLNTGSTYEITASSAVSASWAPDLWNKTGSNVTYVGGNVGIGAGAANPNNNTLKISAAGAGPSINLDSSRTDGGAGESTCGNLFFSCEDDAAGNHAFQAWIQGQKDVAAIPTTHGGQLLFFTALPGGGAAQRMSINRDGITNFSGSVRAVDFDWSNTRSGFEGNLTGTASFASQLFNNYSFVDINGTARFSDTVLSQSYGPTLTFDNPNPSVEFDNTPAGKVEFNCNEWSGSTNRRTVVRISATKDGTVTYGGASGLFTIAVEDTSGAVMDRMVINRFATSFSGSVVATESDNYGRAGFTGSLQGTSSWAEQSVSSSYAMTASALTPSSGLTTNVYISASNGDITMSFVNGLLISVT